MDVCAHYTAAAPTLATPTSTQEVWKDECLLCFDTAVRAAC